MKLRGADILARTLDRAGLRTIFTLSGNHIMPVFDAALGTGLKLVHARHEAAAVHMADAWARLTGECGIALVTGGPGHGNAVGALYTALGAETPVLLLSGHAALGELGRGAFQELDQVAMAKPTVKAAWMPRSAPQLGHAVAEAIKAATSARPGPVHLSLPIDLLDELVDDVAALWPAAAAFRPADAPLEPATAERVVRALREARRPLVLTGPALCNVTGRKLLQDFAVASGVPAIGMESPRGVNDPRLGAFAEVLRQADLIVLIGKPLDFTLRFADPPFVDAACRLIVLDPEPQLIERVTRGKGDRLLVSAVADPRSALSALLNLCTSAPSTRPWFEAVADALAYRPPAWSQRRVDPDAKVHPIDLCRAVAAAMQNHPDAVLICDGGEIGQWPQSLIDAPRRLINGPAGSIGAAIPYALAARMAEPGAPIVAIMGDGTFGFHMAEFDTAVRYGFPFVAVVGNDATWNAEYQIQLREYGAERTHSCELLPARYDLVAAALGGHGELVSKLEELAPALTRALASGKPACVNVMIERTPAPIARRT